MDDLIELLQNHPPFSQLPSDTQEVYLTLANLYQSSPKDGALSLTPEELTKTFQIGSTQHWRAFLQLTPVVNFVRKRMGENAVIASRKAITALTEEALHGDVGAAKHLNDLAGILTKQESNKIIILHQIARPKR